MRLFRILPSPNGRYAPIPLPLAPTGLQAGISLREAGDQRLGSPDREALFRSLGVPAGTAYGCRQVHSRRVVPIGERSPLELAGLRADGLACGGTGSLLTVTVADCLPIFLYDRRGGAFALLHSGWRGTGIVTRAVRLLSAAYGTPPEALVAVIGPGIGPCCYAVDPGRAGGFRRRFGEAAVRSDPGGSTYLDLRAANVSLLARAGVRDVHVTQECTCCCVTLSSFRRDGPGFRRMVAFMGTIPG